MECANISDLHCIAVDQDLREKLLTAIKGDKDDEIEKALRALSEQNPTKGPARSDKLFGKWKLLWASPNSEVAKATKRNPLPSYSEQRIGLLLTHSDRVLTHIEVTWPLGLFVSAHETVLHGLTWYKRSTWS